MVADVTATDIVAVIFDFDDTLAPDTTTALIEKFGLNPEHFWRRDAQALIEQGYDQPTAYLKLLLDNIGSGKPLGMLTNLGLREFGSGIDKTLYAGLPQFFDDARAYVRQSFRNIEVEFYVISGGLYEIIRGSSIINQHFKAVYGCHLAGDTPDGVLKYIKRSITFTEKTRYIFEIHKGLDPVETWRNPILVNKSLAPEERRVPLTNMIYVGDGITDIPCFSLLKSVGGLGFGVFKPAKARTALEEFLQTDRVISMHTPDYRAEADLGAILRAAIANRCSAIQLQRAQPKRQRM